MTATEMLTSVKYVTDINGQKTDVLIPVDMWELFIASWQTMVNQLEDQDDVGILRDWLTKRAAGQVQTITLDSLENELVRDGLLSS